MDLISNLISRNFNDTDLYSFSLSTPLVNKLLKSYEESYEPCSWRTAGIG